MKATLPSLLAPSGGASRLHPDVKVAFAREAGADSDMTRRQQRFVAE
jgi:hypothetical protein